METSTDCDDLLEKCAEISKYFEGNQDMTNRVPPWNVEVFAKYFLFCRGVSQTGELISYADIVTKLFQHRTYESLTLAAMLEEQIYPKPSNAAAYYWAIYKVICNRYDQLFDYNRKLISIGIAPTFNGLLNVISEDLFADVIQKPVKETGAGTKQPNDVEATDGESFREKAVDIGEQGSIVRKEPKNIEKKATEDIKEPIIIKPRAKPQVTVVCTEPEKVEETANDLGKAAERISMPITAKPKAATLSDICQIYVGLFQKIVQLFTVTLQEICNIALDPIEGSSQASDSLFQSFNNLTHLIPHLFCGIALIFLLHKMAIILVICVGAHIYFKLAFNKGKSIFHRFIIDHIDIFCNFAFIVLAIPLLYVCVLKR